MLNYLQPISGNFAFEAGFGFGSRIIFDASTYERDYGDFNLVYLNPNLYTSANRKLSMKWVAEKFSVVSLASLRGNSLTKEIILFRLTKLFRTFAPQKENTRYGKT